MHDLAEAIFVLDARPLEVRARDVIGRPRPPKDFLRGINVSRFDLAESLGEFRP